MRILIPLIIQLLLIIIIINGKQTDKEIWFNGYDKEIKGENIKYHSHIYDADLALLVRAMGEKKAIEWETESIPQNYKSDYVTFTWIAGLAQSKGSHKFHFYINNSIKFTFNTTEDTTQRSFHIRNKEDEELSFKTELVDRAQDLFGFMTLKVHRNSLNNDNRLTLKVVGEDAESIDWYMTFKYKLNPKAEANPIEALINEDGTIMQPVKIDINYFYENSTAELLYEGKSKKINLIKGTTTTFINYIPLKENAEKQIQVKINEQPFTTIDVVLEPVIKREIFILPHSHNDIGYTALQSVIEVKQWKNIEEAVELAIKTKEYPEGSSYKWNMEVLWALESYLKQAPEEKVNRLINAVKEGRICLNALYANELTGLCNSAEFLRLIDFAKKLSIQYGIKINSAMITDIPGYNWGIVTALSKSNIKYFSSGPNYMENNYDLGDRIGWTLKEWGDKPFYWLSSSGKDKVLFWVAGRGYSAFHSARISRAGERVIFNYLKELKEKNYPYEIVQLRYTIDADNGPSDPMLPEFVKQWNEKYVTPILRISTTNELFEKFEKIYSKQIPELKGDFTPYWEDGAFSTTSETVLNRRAADKLMLAEALYSLIDYNSYPQEKFYKAWRNVILYDEHTWGAWNSTSEPDNPEVIAQWLVKKKFATDADSLSEKLLANIFPEMPSDNNVYTIYNPNSWVRSDVVILPGNFFDHDFLFADEDGKIIPSQKLSSGKIVVFIENIPPFASIKIIKKTAKEADNQKMKKSAGNISVSFDSLTGAISKLIWNKNNLADTKKISGINEFNYLPGLDAANVKKASDIIIVEKENGDLFSSFTIEAAAPGCNKLSSEITVHKLIDRIDIVNTIDKKKIREKESVHFAYPFNIPGGKIIFDAPFGIIKSEVDQLKGACKNWISSHKGIDISNSEYGVSVALSDIPLVEVEKISVDTPWIYNLPQSQTFYSYVMNNYWHTNFKVDQDGIVSLRYSIMPHGKFNPAAFKKFTMEISHPLVIIPGDTKYISSLLRINSDEVIVSSIKPAQDKNGWILILQNTSDKEKSVKLNWNKALRIQNFISNNFEECITEIPDEIVISANDVLMIRTCLVD